MNQKITFIGLMLYAACYLLLFCTWAAVVFNKVAGAEQIVNYIQITLAALSGHVLTMLNPGRAGGSLDPAPQAAKEGGFIRLPLLMLIPLIAAAAVMLSACTTTAPAGSTSAPAAAPVIVPLTPAQIAARACPALTLTVTNLQGLLGLSEDVQTKLANAKKVVDAACGASTTVNLTSLQTLLASGIPALQDLVRTVGLPNDEANQLLLGLSVAQVVLAGLVDPLLVAP